MPALYRTYPGLRFEDYADMPRGELDELLAALG